MGSLRLWKAIPGRKPIRAGLTGIGGALVALILVAAPISAYTWHGTTWNALGTTSAAGIVSGTGVVTPALGQPTAAGPGPVTVTFGASASTGGGVGQANYIQTAHAWTATTFVAWKPAGSHYNTSVLYGFKLAAGDLSETVNCYAGGSANATAVIYVEIAIYDVTTGVYAAALGPTPTLTPHGAWGLIAAFATPAAPFNVACIGVGTVTANSLAMTIPPYGNLTGPIGIVLNPGNTYQIEGFLGAYVGAQTTIGGATASATISFAPGDVAEIVNANAW
ncbi:MAG TPA: hypothetical protein VFG07_07225 [Thermoplasmata archaeon]|nr:hypothetical protein [Thermoplasmata archaeon]